MKKTILGLIGVVILILVGSSIYEQLNKKGAKSKRLDCHKNVTVFERVYHQDRLLSIKDLLNDGKFKLEFRVEKSKYMDTQLFEYVDIEQTQDEILNIFNHKEDSDTLKVKVLLYENDKKDPGKKSKEALLYAGYLMFDFYLENSLVYKIQIDFMDMQGHDIKQTIECIKNSIITI